MLSLILEYAWPVLAGEVIEKGCGSAIASI